MSITNGVTFGTLHSYDDFGLILTGKSVPMPERKSYEVDVTGSNGKMDLSTALTDGITVYQNRTLAFQFDLLEPPFRRAVAYSAIAAALHCQQLPVILDEDANWYYDGLCKMTSSNEEAVNHSTVTIEVDAFPYKLSRLLSTEKGWQWDPLRFDATPLPQSCANVYVPPGKTKTFDFAGLVMPVNPAIITNQPITVGFEGVAYEVPAGSYKVAQIVLTPQAHTLTVSASQPYTRVSIEFREGAL